jgi:hypothetical protein
MGPVADPIEWPALDPDATVYRAYPFPDSLNPKTGKPVPKLFYRKADELGLSIGLSRLGLRDRFPGAVGMCKLIVGDVNIPDVGILGCIDPLHIVQDEADHAEIRGVPTRVDDQEKALRIAKYLVRISEHCPE